MSKPPESLERLTGLWRQQADGAKQELAEAHASVLRLQQAHEQLERYRSDYEMAVQRTWQSSQNLAAQLLKDQLAFVAQLRDAEHKSNLRCQQEEAKRQALQQSWQEMHRHAMMMEGFCENRRVQATRVALRREEQRELDERRKMPPWLTSREP